MRFCPRGASFFCGGADPRPTLRHQGTQAPDVEFGCQPIFFLMAWLEVSTFGQVIGGHGNQFTALLICERLDNLLDYLGRSSCNNLGLRIF